MKIGIIGILQNPSKRETSHNAGWTYTLRSQLEIKYETTVDLLTEKDDWNRYQILYITEGVNFRPGVWNLFGGVSDKLVLRLNKLYDFDGSLYFYGNEAPNYLDLVEKRNIDLKFDLKFTRNSLPKKINPTPYILDPENVVLGDSHAISVFEDRYVIDRHDGQTLHGVLVKGIYSYLEHFKKPIKKLRLYFGNIDVRHHLCRLYFNDENRSIAIIELVDSYIRGCEYLIKRKMVEEIEIVELLPIEDESRKIPKTGYHKGQPFWGTREERIQCVVQFNLYLQEQLILKKNINILNWNLGGSLVRLDFKNMESGSSVHLAPHSYMYDFISRGLSVKVQQNINIPDHRKYSDQDSVDYPIQFNPIPQDDCSHVFNVFEINEDVLEAIDEYHEKSLLMQKHYYDKEKIYSLAQKVDDPLIFNVPIYDMLDRRYAAFSSFLEAIFKGDDDPKGNGKYFVKVDPMKSDFEMILLFYLFRLCGSGINYKPKTNNKPFGTHGFGNFWLVDLIKNGNYNWEDWYKELQIIDKPFTDNKGYLLPQFSYENQKGGHLKRFILEESLDLVGELYEFIRWEGQDRTIIECVDHMNKYLQQKGFKKQNFVLSATMADIAEYYPKYIDPNSMIYAGTNAKKCIDLIFKKVGKCSRLEFESACIQFLADRYDSNPYSVEDSRLCDIIRYFKEYQSKYHIEKNNGKIMENNCILKQKWGINKYKEFVSCM
jgi:hypothetical protein